MRIRSRSERRPRILEGGARAAAVAKTAAILSTWTASKFEHEAACRHGIRQSLVLAGHRWTPADLEAAAITAAALEQIGARRPTWLEGQLDYTVSFDTCRRCRGPIPPEDMARGYRYCSSDCASSAYADRLAAGDLAQGEAHALVYKHFGRELNHTRPCAHCEAPFRPAVAHARYCSAICSRLARGDLIEDRECQHCGKTFHPVTRTKGGKYCSPECYAAARTTIMPRDCTICGKHFTPQRDSQTACSRACSRKEPGKWPEKQCECCGEAFHPKHPAGRYCSPKCRRKVGNALTRERAVARS